MITASSPLSVTAGLFHYVSAGEIHRGAISSPCARNGGVLTISLPGCPPQRAGLSAAELSNLTNSRSIFCAKSRRYLFLGAYLPLLRAEVTGSTHKERPSGSLSVREAAETLQPSISSLPTRTARIRDMDDLVPPSAPPLQKVGFLPPNNSLVAAVSGPDCPPSQLPTMD